MARAAKLVAFGLLGLIALLVLAGVAWWLANRAPDIAAETLEARYATPASRYADLGGGIRVHWRDQGRAGAPVLVLVHGFGDNSFSWEGWAKALGGRYHVLSVDLVGHGLTRSPADFAAAPDALAEVLERWAAKAGLGPVAVAGNSLGGAVAWNWALAHPSRVSRLILVDAAGWPPAPSNEKPPLAFRIMRYKLGRDLIASIDNTPLIREGLKRDVVDQSVLTDAFIRRWADLQRLPGHRPILMTVRPGAHAASNEVLAAIRVPTLILWGADDRLIPAGDAERFHRAIAGSEVAILPRAGHLPQLEAASRSAAIAGAFLDRHTPAT